MFWVTKDGFGRVAKRVLPVFEPFLSVFFTHAKRCERALRSRISIESGRDPRFFPSISPQNFLEKSPRVVFERTHGRCFQGGRVSDRTSVRQREVGEGGCKKSFAPPLPPLEKSFAETISDRKIRAGGPDFSLRGAIFGLFLPRFDPLLFVPYHQKRTSQRTVRPFGVNRG